MRQYFTREMIKRSIVVVLSVILMGVGVQFLNRTSLGPDPFSAMNYGVSALLGISLGTYQMIFNGTLFILLFISSRKLFGFGTIANMVLVGYSADFTGWLLDNAGILMPENMTTATRFLVLIPALIEFVFAAAMYINCGVGTSPYDALPQLLHQKAQKLLKKEFPFKVTRMLYDGTATVIAFLVGGSAGIVTVLMVFTLGPAIDFVAGLVKKTGFFNEN